MGRTLKCAFHLKEEMAKTKKHRLTPCQLSSGVLGQCLKPAIRDGGASWQGGEQTEKGANGMQPCPAARILAEAPIRGSFSLGCILEVYQAQSLLAAPHASYSLLGTC